ncbi:MAG: type VI secretion system tube protein Hcp [Tepidisphaeraceae bacterium]|jgi:type VI secretion system secreted protein Hcp
MAFNAFVQIDGVSGEATEEGHKDWIEISEYQFSVSQQSLMSGGQGGRGAGKADFEALTIFKTIDKSTPTLALYCANGKHVSKVTLEISMAAGKKTKFASIVLNNAMISRVQIHGTSKGDSPRPQEVVSFVYDKVIWSYVPVKSDGSTGPESKQGWDISENKQV